MSKPNHQSGKKGYETTYEKALDDVDAFRSAKCEQLAKEWSDPDNRNKAKKKRCPRCGRWTSVHKYHVKRRILTRMGEVEYRRHYYYCHKCSQGFYPKDEELGFEKEEMTDDLNALAMDFVVSSTFEEASQRLWVHHGVRISATGLNHLFAYKSAPLADVEEPCPPLALPLTHERRHRPVMIQADGSMIRHTDGWHELKLLSVGVLGEADRIYLAEARSKDRFEAQLFESEGFARLRKRKVLWIADGAEWIWNMKARLCPHAEELLDYYHAIEHAHDAAKALFGEEDACTPLFTDRIATLFNAGDIERLFDELKECIPYKPRTKMGKKEAKVLWDLLKYYRKNRDRMNYRRFREKGWPIGSGAIESAHKHVIQKRMKMSGMRWSPENAQRMATLRALCSSLGVNRFVDYMKNPAKLAA